VPSIAPHRVYTAILSPLAPGRRFSYRLALAGKVIFQAEARTQPAPGHAMRVAVMGDLGMGERAHRNLVYGLSRQKPHLVVMPGDLVYQDGRISEYRNHFFPVYNADAARPGLGAPLLRSSLVVGVLGNHDVGERGPRHPMAVDPDSMAYYLYWNQPLNGPAEPGAPPFRTPDGWTWGAFLAAAGQRFPTMGTFSFNAGGAHWTVLDSNPYARWDAAAMQDWLERDLQAADNAAWRFVVFHHPAFNFSESNVYRDQWMSRLWPLFERHRVDVVFTGHIHTYVRSRPLHFLPDLQSLAALAPMEGQGALKGNLTWDARFDGKTRTRADGPILIVSGGGGAPLHLKGRARLVQPAPFVARHLPEQHSYSILDLQGGRLSFVSFRQACVNP